MRGYARPGERSAERNQLVLEHLDVARRIAIRVSRRVPDNIRQEDLISAAMVGLAEAAERFEADRGQPFVAFAEKRIRGAVLDELRRGDVMSRRDRVASRKVGEAIVRLVQELGREPEDDEVAAALGVTLQEYQESLETLTHVSAVPLDDMMRDSIAGGDEDPSVGTLRGQLRDRVIAALRDLPPRDQTLLSLYYNEELSYREIGELLGVTESRVCQLHSRAVARLRAALTDRAEEA
jgi:RNA polymerase sigma factor for flagellar operon FliA